MSTTTRSLNTLPVWAQLLIKRLEAQLEMSRERIEELSSPGNDVTRVRVSDFRSPVLMLPERVSVDFWLGNPAGGKYDDGQVVSVSLRERHVSVSSLTGALCVTPESSNTVRVRTGEF